ncbi:MAG: PQQ-dependent sugar dehydrogenase [Candidatus Binatia bacterium]
MRTAAGWRLVTTLIAFAAAPAGLAAQQITLAPFATGLSSPVDIANAGDSRLFVVEQDGYIRVVQSDGTVLGTPFLDVSTLVSGGGEQGLLGLVFDPNYAGNGFFYVNYTDLSGATRIVRYQVSGNPDVANAASATLVIQIPQTASNHNGGDLNFGPDGYLYIGMGDGGGGCDPLNDAQDPNELLGKMLRLDVDPLPYTIPPSNPFVGPDGIRDEIWAIGTRNPWRFSFDRSTGDLYIADVGQNALEEIDFQPAAGGGENYGWDCYEGNSLSSGSSGCSTIFPCLPASNFVFPVHQYNHSGGRCSVTGGFVYRGTQFPSLVGQYFFADVCSADFYSLTTNTWNLTSYGVPSGVSFPTSFGEGADGELYVTGGGNTIFHVRASSLPPTCPAAPTAGCAGAAKSKLLLKQPGDQTKNKLLWKWAGAAAVDAGDFGDPVGDGTSYSLCLYAGTAQVALDAGVAGVTNWKTTSSGYKYSDKTAPGDGIFKVLLKSGAAGKGKVLVKGKGGNLDLSAMALGLTDPLQVQLIRNDGPECFETTFQVADVSADSGTLFKAKYAP